MWNNFLHLEVEKCISTILANNPIESEDGKEQHPLLVHVSILQKTLRCIHSLLQRSCVTNVSITYPPQLNALSQIHFLAVPQCSIGAAEMEI